MKRILSIFMFLMMILMANSVYAENLTIIDEQSDNYEISVCGIVMKSGDYLENGKSATQTTIPSEGYAYFNDGILTLNNFSYKGSRGYRFVNGTTSIIYGGTSPLTICLEGNNYIKHTNLGYCISSDSDVTIEGFGSLTINNDYSAIYLRNSGNLTINSGYYELESVRGSALNTFNGNITINGGKIYARNNGIYYDDYYYWAINHGSGSIFIAEGVSVQASTDPFGTPGSFDPASIKTYDYVVIDDVITLDINQDGVFDGKDEYCLKLHISDISKDQEYNPVMDLNKDGKINAKDLLILKNILKNQLRIDTQKQLTDF